MIWVCRSTPPGFEDLSLAEMKCAGLTQVSKRFFYGDHFDLQKSAYTQFSLRELSRGHSPEEAIKNIRAEIPSPYRMEKFKKKRRYGSLTFSRIAEQYLKGDNRATDPACSILVFTPDDTVWIAGFIKEKTESVLNSLNSLTSRTCMSLSSQAALAIINITKEEPLVDPCCGTGMLPLAAKLCGKEVYMADNSWKMLELARKNRETLGLDCEMKKRDAFEPWIDGCCLVSDFPADRSWVTHTEDLSLKLFTAWIPHIKSFCVIFPDRILKKLPENVIINQTIRFTAGRSIVKGTVTS